MNDDVNILVGINGCGKTTLLILSRERRKGNKYRNSYYFLSILSKLSPHIKFTVSKYPL